jgi:hypothetical protein
VGNSIEQIAAGVYIVAIIGFVILCNGIKNWLCGVPPVSMKQRERIGTWRLRQIMKGRATHRDVLQLEPTESELEGAKQNIIGGFALRIDSNRKIHDYLGVIGFYRLPLDYLDVFTAKVEAVTLDQIRDAFRRRIDPSRMVTVVVGAKTAP